jgi:uncharacterized membrane protein
MNPTTKNALNLGLIMLATVLLVLGILMAYESWNALIGVMVVLVAWVLLSLIHLFVREAKA